MVQEKRTVTFALLDEGTSASHRLGVNSLTSTCASVWGTARELFTAGRDGSVRCWRDFDEGGGHASRGHGDGDAAGGARLQYTVDEHTDWVNDLALVMDGDLASAVVSASSDRTIKLWRPQEDGGAPTRHYTLRQHTDFVKALAYARDGRTLASAGCDLSIVVWDMHRLAPCLLIGGETGAHADSIYALSTTPSGGLLASGAVDGSLRLWDPRAKAAAVASLLGHTDVVRGAVLSSTGDRLLSCSSDHTVRLWSLSQRRVELELRPHSDSVFSILPGAGFRSVLSASRDGTVAWSSLVPGAPREEGGAVGRDGGDLASRLLFTAGGAVHSLHTPAWSEQRLWVATTDSSILCWPLPPDVASPLHHNGDSMADSLAASPAASPHATFLLRAPCCRIAGSPAVRQLAVLPSKVHLLSEDTQGRVTLWDVSRGRCVRHFDPGSKYEQLLKEYSQKPHAHKASWFGASAQSGTIEITLEPGSTFNAEAYSSDLGLASEGDDVRLNLGERLLRALFAQWKQPAPRASPQPAPPPELAFRPLDETPVRLCEDGRVVARTLASRLSELPSDAVPHWVAQAVLHGQYTPKEPLKMSFFLQPHPESGLPPLPADCNKLSAAKVLKVRKVVQYVEDRLPDSKPVQLLCGNVPLEPTMTLSAVRAFVWKSSDEMALFYGHAPSAMQS